MIEWGFEVVFCCSVVSSFLSTVYLVTRGINPREHGIKQELVCASWFFFSCFFSEVSFISVSFISSWSGFCVFVLQERIRAYMNRVKEITDKKKAARLDKGAASRFIRSALYEPDDKDSGKKNESKKQADSTAAEPPPKRQKQRKWRRKCVLPWQHAIHTEEMKSSWVTAAHLLFVEGILWNHLGHKQEDSMNLTVLR